MSRRRTDNPNRVSRRDFVTTAAMAGAGVTILPRHVLGRGFQAPSDTVNIATVGIGGMGGSNTRELMSQNIVAVADVDWSLLDRALKGYQDDWAKAQDQMQQTPPRTRVRSPAQLAANERRPAQNSTVTLKRFLDDQLPRLKRYKDYREMLDKQKDIDAVVV